MKSAPILKGLVNVLWKKWLSKFTKSYTSLQFKNKVTYRKFETDKDLQKCINEALHKAHGILQEAERGEEQTSRWQS